MTDRVKGLRIVRGEQFPISRSMTDSTLPDESGPPAKMLPPVQAKASRKPGNPNGAAHPIKIADDKKGTQYDGKLARVGADQRPKRPSAKPPKRKSQQPRDRASHGFNDEEVGAATGFLQALLAGGFEALEPRGAVGPSSSVPVQDPALAQPPPGAAIANQLPIARGR